MDTNKKFTASPTEAGQRIEVFLCQEIAELSRRRARNLCESGLVTVNNRKVPSGFLLRKGDVVCCEVSNLPTARAELARKSATELMIVYEDDLLIAINKPPLMHCVTLTNEDPLTLADCIAAYCPACLQASPDPREAGLIHRLDYSTSGIVVAAKSRHAWNILHQSLLNEEWNKVYYALVENTLPQPSLIIEKPIRQSRDGKRMEIVDKEQIFKKSANKTRIFSARTKVQTVSSFYSNELTSQLSIVKAEASKAARHQIRVHLAYLKCPLVGDILYDSKFSTRPVVTNNSRLSLSQQEGFFLHAESLSFFHPQLKTQLELQAESTEFFLRGCVAAS